MKAGTTLAAEYRRRRPAGGAAAAMVAVAVILSGCGSTGSGSSGSASGQAAQSTAATIVADPPLSPPSQGSAAPSGPAAATVPTGPAGSPGPAGHSTSPIPVRPATLPAAAAVPAPTSLAVAGTAINMPVVAGGVSAEGAMEIPDAFDRAAWYKFGPAPGAAEGTAVIAGHIDTKSDRAPFSALKSLAAGTLIRVGRDGAAPLTYRVVGVEMMAKDKFDGGALFRRSGPHQLKLVTCGGRWLDERMDYSDNVIVTAVPE
ncbi:class F sortase [Arthrobacter sp. SAFR-179]|uniref:class F sortase n=1 Tax=Arthrobacter sp. SAFR-179 TaxID=3387279 RepID=UPI003F7C2821